jgi:RNA polymerase sigma-70 factor (ECF subfamily)
VACYTVGGPPLVRRALPNIASMEDVDILEGIASGGKSRPVETELELIKQAQQGDRRAFGQLVRLHREGAVNVVYRMCGDAELAEEAAQEAFIRAWTNLPRYKPRSPFRNWLYRIATNVAVDALRSQKETVDVESVDVPDAESGPEALTEVRERGERVRQAVLALPPASRAVVVLREYEDLSYKEIADTLGIPIGTVMSRLNYARSLLRQTLTPYMEGV